MKRFMSGKRWGRKALFDLRTLVAIAGLILSVVLHEVFHILVHWGHIVSMKLFPDSGAIFEVISQTSAHYDPQLEEGIAYGITMLTIIVTVAVLFYLTDKKDTRGYIETVVPKNSPLQSLKYDELLELAGRVHSL